MAVWIWVVENNFQAKFKKKKYYTNDIFKFIQKKKKTLQL